MFSLKCIFLMKIGDILNLAVILNSETMSFWVNQLTLEYYPNNNIQFGPFDNTKRI